MKEVVWFIDHVSYTFFRELTFSPIRMCQQFTTKSQMDSAAPKSCFHFIF